MKKYDIICLGESLVDFVPIDGSFNGNIHALAGGAPTNVACGLARLGMQVGLLSRVGADPLGMYVMRAAENCGVDTSMVQIDKSRFTTVTIVMPKSEDMLRYAIYRENSADTALTFEELPEDLFQNAKLLHCGSLSMASERSQAATLKAIEAAHRCGMCVSVDVNLRPNAWANNSNMIKQANQLVALSDIVKLTKDEAQVLGLSVEKLDADGKLVVVTDGPNGAEIYGGGCCARRPALDVEVRDVTGGGDAFMSAFLYCYLKNAGKLSVPALIEDAIEFCIRASSVAIQRYGAIDSLPTIEEIHMLGGKTIQ